MSWLYYVLVHTWLKCQITERGVIIILQNIKSMFKKCLTGIIIFKIIWKRNEININKGMKTLFIYTEISFKITETWNCST